MRYIIEAETAEELNKLVESGQVEMIDSYDPIERLTGRVERMRLVFEEFKKNRGSWKIMNYYLRGRGIAQNEIDTVLNGLEDFFKQV